MTTLRPTTSSLPDLPSLAELTTTSSNTAFDRAIDAEFAQPALLCVELGGLSGGQHACGKGQHGGGGASVALKYKQPKRTKRLRDNSHDTPPSQMSADDDRAAAVETSASEVVAVQLQSHNEYKELARVRHRQPRRASEDQSEPIERDKIQAKDPAFEQRVPPPASRSEVADTSFEPLNLAPALKRKVDWTPPRRPSTITVQQSSRTGANWQTFDSPSRADEQAGGKFRELRDKFIWQAETEPDLPWRPAHASTVLGNRKPLDLVQSKSEATPPLSVVPAKKKSPVKKPRTITDLATAGFRSANERQIFSDLGSIVETTQSATTPSLSTKRPTDNDKLDLTDKTSKSGKYGNKKKVTKRPGKRQTARRSPLLSPSTALRQVSRQGFMFGTSSQLASGLSPEVLKQVEQTIQATSLLDEDPFTSSSPRIPPIAMEHDISKQLWAAGTRNAEGELIVATQKDYEQALRKADERRLAQGNGSELQQRLPAQANLDKLADQTVITVSSSPVPAPSKSPFFATQLAASQGLQAVLSSDDAEEPPPSNQEHKQLIDASMKSPPQRALTKRKSPVRPRYELFTDAQLAKEVKRYGFKPIKRRTAMLALLDQCWVSKTAGASLEATRPVSTTATLGSPQRPAKKNSKPRHKKSTTITEPGGQHANSAGGEPTKRPRGRPRKQAEKAIPETAISSFKDGDGVAIDIADTASEDLFESPRTARSTSLLPDITDVTLSDETEVSLVASPSDAEGLAFTYMAKAILTAPRSTDPQHPSWHEKMLLYDPIVVEDLAAWLNAGQLDRVGYESEVSPHDVKRWCETRSVCCLWKVNIRGRERKRF